MSASLIAPRRVPTALIRVAQIQARLAGLRSLMPLIDTDERRGEIYDADGQPVLWPVGLDETAPPEIEAAPSEGEPARDETDAEFARRGADAIAQLDAHDAFCVEIDALDARRNQVRRELQTWALEYNPLIESDRERMLALKDELHSLNDELFVFDEVEGYPLPSHQLIEEEEQGAVPPVAEPARALDAYERAGIAVAAMEERRLALPFWRFYDAQLDDTLAYERDCRRAHAGDANARRTSRYGREVPCTSKQVAAIERRAGGAASALALVACDSCSCLSSLRLSEASALISWLDNGRPDA